MLNLVHIAAHLGSHLRIWCNLCCNHPTRRLYQNGIHILDCFQRELEQTHYNKKLRAMKIYFSFLLFPPQFSYACGFHFLFTHSSMYIWEYHLKVYTFCSPYSVIVFISNFKICKHTNIQKKHSTRKKKNHVSCLFNWGSLNGVIYRVARKFLKFQWKYILL